ncbi:Golgi transport complex subunit COG6 ASCRUDRAFT_56090 [Ascoidea rubescens DSM 1968]|uniref:Conserved oligomeric Golgi complex subunit 6 n=1 Tax=Ascoidea rubescens DSM 1968 TaxID=1344418 RepID=A0A1D2VM29_9ASCO|nr:hypothetical protein ASCRUDRAFT_56090 [Ascoidea rubescens DSM 1968]ODV62668.1 hypothetical protein ASCRUDRAFT_56090 [Ascoidea rubescens DSM 1968]
MDFIYDYSDSTANDVHKSSGIPLPAAPLTLPLNLPEEITKKLPGLSILSNLQKNYAKSTENINDSTDNLNLLKENDLAEKYARLSLELLASGKNRGVSSANISSNILSTKLSKILSSSLTTSYNTPLDLKIKKSLKILEANNYFNVCSDDEYNSYNTLVQPGFLGSITRKNLQSKVENELLKQHSKILVKFQPLIDVLEHLKSNIENLNVQKDNLVNDLNNLTKFNEENLSNDKFNINQIKALQHEKNLILIKKHILMSFKNEFQINEYEEYVIKNTNLTNSDNDDETLKEFFKVYNKIKKIYQNCYLLLSMNNPTIGINIMNKMKGLIDNALNKIFYFVEYNLNNFQNINKRNFKILKESIKIVLNSSFLMANRVEDIDKDSAEESFSVSKFVENNVYVNNLINKIIEVRAKQNLKDFLDQLGTSLLRDDNQSMISVKSKDSARPILMSAHDPIRYIGDILAYIHSLIVNEKEIIDTLLDNNEDFFDFRNGEDLKEYLLIKTLNVLAKPLNLRVSRFIMVENKLNTIQNIFNVLDLYDLMFLKQFDVELMKRAQLKNELLISIKTLEKFLHKRAFAILEDSLNEISSLIEQNIESHDLQSPEWLINYVNDIQKVFYSFHPSSNSELNNFLFLSDQQMDDFLKLVIDRPLSLVYKQADLSSFDEEAEKSKKIFEINSIDFILSKILTISFIKNEKINELNIKLDSETQFLIYVQFDILIESCGLSLVFKMLNSIYPYDKLIEEYAITIAHNPEEFLKIMDKYISLKSKPEFSIESINTINKKIELFLPSALTDTQSSALINVSSPMISNQIIEESSLKFVDFYKIFFILVVRFYDNTLLLKWNEIEVATLLGVDELYIKKLQMEQSLN